MKCSILWQSNWRRIRYFYNHLEWPPKIMGFIHLRNVCQKEVITFRKLWEECTEEEALLMIRGEYGRNWRSSSHDSNKIPQAMRDYMKDSILEEPLIHLSIWIRNEWRIWWSWRIKKDSTHETNKDKYSIVISWYCFFCYTFVWCIMHDRMFALMTVYY